MDALSEEEFKIWEIKRNRTVYGYLVISLLCGIDYSFLFATLYLYLTTLVQADDANFYYGIIIAAFCLSSTVTGIISGYIIDKNRKLKSFSIIALTLLIIGNLLYTIYLSPIYLLVGRFIAGTSDSFTSVACGEIVRIYDNKEGTSVMWRIAAAYSVGFAVGPCIGVIFKGSVDFHVGLLYFNYLNFTSVVIAIMGMVALLLSLFLLHDCSLEFDMKKFLSDRNKKTETYGSTDEKKTTSQVALNENSKLFVQLKQIFSKEGNVLLIMVSSFVFVYCLLGLDMLLPLLTINTMKWGYNGFVVVSAVYAVVYFLVLLLCSKYCITRKSIYFMTILCIVCNMICLLAVLLIVCLDRILIRDVLIMSLFLLAYTFVWFLDEVLVRNLIARMVPSHVQSLVEAIRNGFSRMGTVVAALTVAISFPVIHYWCIGMQAIMLLFLSIFLTKYKSLIDIKEVQVS